MADVLKIVAQQLADARARNRLSPTLANAEECERLYVLLCRIKREEESRIRETFPVR